MGGLEAAPPSYRRRALDQPQPKSGLELSTIVRAATFQAGNGASDSPNSGEITLTIRAFVQEPSRACADWEWQSMTAQFVGDPEILTGNTPFRSVRREAALPRPELREKMRKFVAQCAVDFSRAVVVEARIQGDHFCAVIGAASRGFETRIPEYAQRTGYSRRTGGTQKRLRARFQLEIAPGLL